MTVPRKLLAIGHSYSVGVNRRLAHEMARIGHGRWNVTVAAPKVFHGMRDLRAVTFQRSANEADSIPIDAYCTKHVHLFFYSPVLRKLLSEKWEAIHCWEEPYVLAGWQVAKWARRSAKLVYLTGQNIVKSYPFPFRWMERQAMGRAAGWIAMGHTAREAQNSRISFRKRPSRVIPLGVDTGMFRPEESVRREIRRELNWDVNGPPVVGFAGRFVPEKGLSILMQSLDRIREPWRGLFVGNGPMVGSLRKWALRYGSAVRICTNVEHESVPRYFNGMDLLCVPSQTTSRWREQFGRVIIEAFAAGVPVVGSDSGEIPNVIGNSGIILPERDVRSWAETLGAMLHDDGKRRQLSARGRERAESEFAWAHIARRNLEFIDEIASDSNAWG